MQEGGEQPIHFYTTEVLPLLYDRRDWLRLIYETTIDAGWVDFLIRRYTPLLRDYLERTKTKSVFSTDIRAKLIIRQILAIIAAWLTENHPKSPLLFQEDFIYLLTTPTSKLLGFDD